MTSNPKLPLLIVALLSGCVGTIDSLHYVAGEAPTDRGCEVKVLGTGTADVFAHERVRGKFSVGYTSSGPFPPRVDIVAYCDGAKIKELKRIAPRDYGTIDLGQLSP